jgi:hypothetical protein
MFIVQATGLSFFLSKNVCLSVTFCLEIVFETRYIFFQNRSISSSMEKSKTFFSLNPKFRSKLNVWPTKWT